jgi:porphobilinogen deaminase
MKIKIATRQSELAMYQANFVANEIKKKYQRC